MVVSLCRQAGGLTVIRAFRDGRRISHDGRIYRSIRPDTGSNQVTIRTRKRSTAYCLSIGCRTTEDLNGRARTLADAMRAWKLD
ncbi:hypothetical protein Bcep1808_4763 [Burkholderia vietnamiensis G4]|uniref:Uncharacterized protein n=1 Tax=Burkholderia vietnamiensis (strain G4 / LMG 22486) TaxID=269482 RepID=A4JN67_BURVG|nr:hypothetical protein Bcep1808_4763 [Burkholderia vietnamiensis G4]